MANMHTIVRGGRVVLHVPGVLEAVMLHHKFALPAGEAVQAALDVYAGKEGALC